jgi:1-acyl-sn-glycerol-3-phosphate acyltransferase
MPHFKAFLARGAFDAVVSYGEPIAADASTDRKVLARQLQGAVRGLATTTLLGRPRPGPASAS